MVIDVPFKKLKSVVHISDIHIRLFKRHEEYRDAFETLYQDIRNKNLEDFIIVIAGDVVHAKTDMSPEMVDLTSEFLSNLADIAPTILIAGNHDCNLANRNRMDSLTPIVDNLTHSNLYYAKYSSIITVADTDFAIHSILDDKESWPSATDCTSPNKIALYHGPVHGAVTDADYVITNQSIHVDDFDGYDIVMLGDIHRHQVLQEYNPTVLKPIIVYSSSLIQQNHGETVDGHGWCLWDIESRSFEFVPLENDYGYCTIEIHEGQLYMPSRVPNKARVRLFTGILDATEVKKLITSLRTKHNIIELSVNKNRAGHKSSTAGHNYNHDTLDLTQTATQNALIVDWLKRTHPNIDDDSLVEVQNLNIETNSKVQHDDHSRNVNWRPLSFKFSNMFSYGEGNEINFSELNGIYGLFAANASGKSSVMDALMFCLYDKTPRAFKGHDIMNNRKKHFDCELIFEIDDIIYGITKEGARKTNGDVKVNVDFWKIENGDRISLNGESRRDTNANIRNYVGTYEDFIMTAFSSQNANALFIDKSHSERKDLLMQFMGLGILDKLHAAANDEMKELNGVLKRFNKSNVTDELAETHDKMIVFQEELAQTEDQKKALEDEVAELLAKYNDLQERKIPIPDVSDSIENLNKQLSNLKQELDDAHILKQSYMTGLKQKHSDLNKVINDLKNYDSDLINTNVQLYSTLEGDLLTNKNKLEVVEASVDAKTQAREHLSKHEYNPDCEVCVNNNASVIGDLETIENELTKLLKIQTVLIKEIEDAEIQMKKLEEFPALQKEFNDLTATHDTLTREIERLEFNIEKVTISIKTAETSINKVKQDIDLYYKNETAILHNKDFEEKMREVNAKIYKTKDTITTLETTIRKLHGEVSVCEAQKLNLQNKIKEVEELEGTHQAYDYYMSAINRNGIPYELITDIVPHIESEINGILDQIVNFKISLEVDGKNINGRIIYDHDKVWPLENSSGMERFISSLAIRVALMNVSNLPKPNFLIIDEGFGVLDSENLNSMNTLFNLLKSQFDFILIVSHLDSARDMVDNLIEIKRDNGYSMISV